MVERNGLMQLAGIRTQSNDSVVDAIYGSFLNPVNYDPSGETKCKPLRISRRHGLKCYLGGFGNNKLIIDERFAPNHVALTSTLAVRFADYRRMRDQGVPLEAIERWTGHDMKSLFGRQGDDLLPALVPSEYLDGRLGRDSWHMPQTTIADNFNRANENLEASADWALLSGVSGAASFDILSNQCREDLGLSDRGAAQHQTSLSSDDHYAQVTIEALVAPASTRSDGGAYARLSSNTGKHNGYVYQATIESDSAIKGRIFKSTGTAPTATVLVDETETIVVTDTIRVEADGSSITGKINGTITAGPTTDTALTGTLTAGLEARIESGSVGDIILDNFEAADLAAAVGIRHWQHERHYPRGIMHGVLRGVIR